MSDESLLARTSRRRVRWIWWLAALATCACTAPVLAASPPGPGAPKITVLEIMPARIESGCPVTLRIDFQDLDGDVVRAVTRWRARFGSRRFHEETEALPIAVSALAGKTLFPRADRPVLNGYDGGAAETGNPVRPANRTRIDVPLLWQDDGAVDRFLRVRHEVPSAARESLAHDRRAAAVDHRLIRDARRRREAVAIVGKADD